MTSTSGRIKATNIASNIAKDDKENKRADFDWAINLNRMMLNVIGVWPDNAEHRLGRQLQAPFICLLLFCCFSLPQIYALRLTHRQLPLLVDNVISTSASIVSIAKVFFMWYNRRVFSPLIASMNADWQGNKNTREHELMTKQARRGRLFAMSGYATMAVATMFFLLSPFFNLSVRVINNITDLDDKRFLPLQSFYPYDFTRSPYFELTYFTQLVAIGFGAVSFTAVDNFFGALVFHASGQCEILAARVARLRELVESGGNVLILFKIHIRHAVEFHVYLIRFVSAIEKSFNLLILAHVLGLSVTTCFIGFGAIQTLKAGSTIVETLPNLLLVVDMLLHMLIYCIATETLTCNSAEYFQAIYDCNWHLLPPKCARDIIMILNQSNCPLILTAGKFSYLSMAMYIQILKSITGYISVLLAVI